jgi:cytosine/adenosine deaminase-related metal-dependent hydrolase
MFLENKIGSLEVGKKADIAIWDRDLYAVPIDEGQKPEMPDDFVRRRSGLQFARLVRNNCNAVT